MYTHHRYVYVQELSGERLEDDARLSHKVVSKILTSHNAVIMGNREQVGIAEAFTQLMNQVRLDHADDPLILFLEEDFRVDSDILKPSSTYCVRWLEV